MVGCLLDCSLVLVCYWGMSAIIQSTNYISLKILLFKTSPKCISPMFHLFLSRSNLGSVSAGEFFFTPYLLAIARVSVSSIIIS